VLVFHKDTETAAHCEKEEDVFVTKRRLRKAVEHGASVLDENAPDWFLSNRVDLGRLDERFPDMSVIGQLADGDYSVGSRSFGIPDTVEARVQHGFETPDPWSRRQCRIATDFWRHEVLTRRARLREGRLPQLE
jgi:hypothetical protein